MEGSIKTNIFCALLFTLFVYSTGANLTTTKVSFIPKKYTLEITTTEDHFKDGDSNAMKFKGVVNVDFIMEKPVGFDKDFQIMLNVNPKTEVSSYVLKGAKENSNEYLSIANCKKYHNKDKLFFNCTKDVKFEKFLLEIEYTNPFGNDMTGFYRSSYKDSSNKTRWLLTTHFEPIFARNAFPCFDHPKLKALFKVSVSVPKTIPTVLSNTPIKVKKEVGNSHTYEFEETEVPMSTYLVAFTASDFHFTEPKEFTSSYEKSGEKKKITTFGRKDIIDAGDGNFAQTVGVEAIEKLTEYLKIGYAFKKIDQVGIPDFSAGAMENWGHISFREKSLFFNEKKSSTITKQSNVLTITHELVHQWFGNLVTLESWDYIWLNEAFATYIEYVIACKFQKTDTSKWNLMNQLVVNEIHIRAFETDGLASSKPLNNEIIDESFIFSSFNEIPYSKGAAVLRMWDLSLKDDGFQKTLNHYLKERKESTANPTQLYEAFERVTQMQKDFFKTWTEQPGYPVVEVKKINGSYHLSQSRFFWGNSTDKSAWFIPISYSTKSSKNFSSLPSHWLHKEPIKINATDKWIIVNNKQAGYYRVNYEEENWIALSQALLEKNHSEIPEVNRAQIINDVFSLARSLQKKYVNYSTAMKLTKYLTNEMSFVPWKTALNAFDFLNTKLYKDSVYDNFKKYVLSLVNPHFKSLNLTKMDHLGKLMGIEICRWSCSLDSASCVKEAKALFKNSEYTKLPDTQEIILCTVVRNDEKIWEDVFQKYKNEEDSALKVMYLSALGCTSSENQIKVFLNKTLSSDSGIRKQDLIYVLSSVYNGNLKNIDIVFDFVERNFQEIAKDFGGINPLGRALVGIAKSLNTKKQVDKLEALVKKIKGSPEGKAAAESAENALRIANSNLKWTNERMDQLKTYLNAGSYLSYSFGLLLLSLISVVRF